MLPTLSMRRTCRIADCAGPRKRVRHVVDLVRQRLGVGHVRVAERPSAYSGLREPLPSPKRSVNPRGYDRLSQRCVQILPQANILAGIAIEQALTIGSR